ncbi:hypothetical protein L7F22_057782 [Adiantum nelumboides]|nr:hypothetical protein [Adiantum nelumboides]
MAGRGWGRDMGEEEEGEEEKVKGRAGQDMGKAEDMSRDDNAIDHALPDVGPNQLQHSNEEEDASVNQLQPSEEEEDVHSGGATVEASDDTSFVQVAATIFIQHGLSRALNDSCAVPVISRAVAIENGLLGELPCIRQWKKIK